MESSMIHRFSLRASVFLLVLDLAQKVANYMIGINLMSYLMTLLKFNLKKSAEISNYWGGCTAIASLLGAILANSYIGRRFSIILVSSFTFLMGLGIFTMAEFIPGLPEKTQTHTGVLLFCFSIICIASGGLKLSLESLTDDQFIDHHDHLKNWWKLAISILNFFASLWVSYSYDIWDWGFTNIGLVAFMTIGISVFYGGKGTYRVRMSRSSPNLPDRVNLCRLTLLWLACMMFGLYKAQTSTFFVLQTNTMNRTVGHRIELPPTVFICISTIGVESLLFFLTKLLVPILQRRTNREQGTYILRRIEVVMLLTFLGLIIAAVVESKRLRVIKHTPEASAIGPIDMSIFWLLPQGMLTGIIEGLILSEITDYFEDHVPQSTSSLTTGFYMSGIGTGSIMSGLLIQTVDHTTKKTSGRSWFDIDLDSSRVDNFFWVLAATVGLYFITITFIALKIRIRELEK